MTTWKDVTSFGQNEPRDGRVPRSWQCETKAIRVNVFRHRDYPPDVWCMTCYDIGISMARELKSKGEAEAKMEALGIARQRLLSMLHDVEGWMKE